MKKTVQIVTIPLDKEGWKVGDLIKLTVGIPYLGGSYFSLAKRYIKEKATNYQAQQLLVLSDDEILKGDWYLFDNVYLRKDGGYVEDKDHRYKKVIASYPQIEGTLSISKETVQAWIDSGTPEEGSVDMLYWCKNGDSLAGCEKQTHCNCSDNTEADIDSKGNLLLEFDKKPLETTITESFIKMATSATGSAFVTPEFAAIGKPFIPTDEEIEEKFKELYKDNRMDFKGLSTPLHPLFTAFLNYQYGYKQALKDLGYE